MDHLVWITLIVAFLIYSLYNLKHGKDPKEEFLKVKQQVWQLLRLLPLVKEPILYKQI